MFFSLNILNFVTVKRPLKKNSAVCCSEKYRIGLFLKVLTIHCRRITERCNAISGILFKNLFSFPEILE